ncbi:MAG: patatin-like phospholipase family protein [Leptospira sp.]|nr:patatin-like phospholipase family protein [Leptospira sp.]
MIDFLNSVDLFQGLSETTLTQIYNNCEEQKFHSHDIIYAKGELSRNIYIIRYGEVRINLDFDGGVNRYLGPGEVLAENSLLTGQTHSATAMATLNCLIYILDGNYFLKLASKEKFMSHNLVLLMGKRMRENLEGDKGKHSHTRRLVTHIPLEPIENFREKVNEIVFLEAGEMRENVSVVDIKEFAFDEPEQAETHLSDMKKKSPVLHLFSDSDSPGPGLENLIIQSDHIVFWEIDREEYSSHKNNVLEYWKPRVRNFEDRFVRYVTSVSKDGQRLSRKDKNIYFEKDRVSRFLISKTRGLALGGGGARALAHIGLIKVLERSGIKIDFISGASMGAVIGALYSRGETPESMEKFFIKNFTGIDSVFDPTLPVYAFYKGKKMERMLRAVFENELIENLPIPFSTSAVDLQDGEEYIFDKGFVWEALRSAISLPAVFPPFVLQEHMLIDGGMLNNVPVSLVKKKGADIVLGVNVSPLQDLELFQLLEDRGITKKSFLKNVVENVKHPPIMKIMARALHLEGREITKLKRDTMDLFLNFHVEEFGLFDFEKCKSIVSRGEEEAEKHLKEIVAVFSA